MKTESWIWIDFSGEPEALELLTADLTDSGLSGCEERGPTGLRFFWPLELGRPQVSSLATKAAQRVSCQVKAEGLQEREDWPAGWKEFFQPLRVSKRLWVCPPWQLIEPGHNEHRIVIDQKRAFGTGHHASTRLALEWLDEVIKPGDTFLDVGCGTGVLSIGAVCLGASQVRAVDNDQHAVDEARANLELNGSMDRVELSCSEFSEFPQTRADYVVANVLVSKMRPILPKLAASCVKQLLLSGIDVEESEPLRNELPAAGLCVIASSESDGWCAYACKPHA